MTSSDADLYDSGGISNFVTAFGDMAWAEPQYSREQVNVSGNTLISDGDYLSSKYWRRYNEALLVINNWRAAHGYPLNTFQVNLRRTSRRVDTGALVAQRIKRLSSIDAKLRRFPLMKLSQMQDMGGCRAVVNSVRSVSHLLALYEKSSMKHKRATVDDYIGSPRNSGYRGVHLTYKYFSDKPAKAVYNDLKIEMQLRSRYQHAWATAVETVGTFVQQALKSSIGEKKWLRFFELMGTAIAMRERCPLVPETPTDRGELVDELSHYARMLNVEVSLTAYNKALQILESPSSKNAHFYLLELDTGARTINVTGFLAKELEEAVTLYLKAERETKSAQANDTVLVSVDSLASLRRAYPNYFADTRVFLSLMRQALSGNQKRIYI